MITTGDVDTNDQFIDALEDIADILKKATKEKTGIVVNVPQQQAPIVNVPDVNITSPDLRPVLLDIAKHLKDIVSYQKQSRTTVLDVSRDGVGRIETISITKK